MFENPFLGISNVSIVGKLTARRIVAETELFCHFLVAYAVGHNFLRILILGLDLNWRNVRLGYLVLYYLELQLLWAVGLLQHQQPKMQI